MASSSHLKPGEKGQISAKIETKGRTGSISKSIQVFSNDPKKPTVTLLLKALIK